MNSEQAVEDTAILGRGQTANGDFFSAPATILVTQLGVTAIAALPQRTGEAAESIDGK